MPDRTRGPPSPDPRGQSFGTRAEPASFFPHGGRSCQSSNSPLVKRETRTWPARERFVHPPRVQPIRKLGLAWPNSWHCAEKAELLSRTTLRPPADRPLSAASRELARVRRNGQDSKAPNELLFEILPGFVGASTDGPPLGRKPGRGTTKRNLSDIRESCSQASPYSAVVRTFLFPLGK